MERHKGLENLVFKAFRAQLHVYQPNWSVYKLMHGWAGVFSPSEACSRTPGFLYSHPIWECDCLEGFNSSSHQLLKRLGDL